MKKARDISNRVKMMFMVLYLTMMPAMVSHAAESYAENGTKWILDQLFWVVICACIILLVGAFMKRSTVAMITIVIMGGMMAFFCKNPEKVIEMGETFARAITGG